MSTLNIKQLRGKNLLIEVDEKEAGDVLVPDGMNYGESHSTAKVILVGDEVPTDPYTYSIGDRIMIRAINRGREYDVNGGTYLLMPETDVIAII